MVAQEIALQAPDLVRKLILVGTGPRGSSTVRLATYLREVVGDRKPRSLAGDVHVELRSDARVVVQRAQR